jgi:hypothetical protein
LLKKGRDGTNLLIVRDDDQRFLQCCLELLLQESGRNADAQGDTNLLAHVVHADSYCHVLPRGTVVETDELCGEDYAGKKTEWEGGKGFQSACNVIGFSYVLLELVLRAWLDI